VGFAEKSFFNGKSFSRNPLPTPLAENRVALGDIPLAIVASGGNRLKCSTR
jgi:hypothetical protein